ncbi:MAG TPA: YdcF family protein [Planctomycetota bacterium]
MSYCGLPARKGTARRVALARRALAILDGPRLLLGVALIVDAARSLFTPDASLLGLLLRWPGGRPLPILDGVLLGAALLVRHRASTLVLVAHAALAAVNIGEFYALKADGLRAAALPFSLVALGTLFAGIARHLYDGPPAPWGWSAAGALASAPALLLLHLFSFGATDYARPADAIVVFGAGVSDDGAPSLALWDRMRHGIALERRGVAPRLVLSGGPDEVPVMRRLALEAGVPESALVLDPEGLNTWATLRNLKERRVVAVSHYYHLARIKLAARRLGISCATAPCAMSRRLQREPWYVARECAAFVSYYFFRG